MAARGLFQCTFSVLSVSRDGAVRHVRPLMSYMQVRERGWTPRHSIRDKPYHIKQYGPKHIDQLTKSNTDFLYKASLQKYEEQTPLKTQLATRNVCNPMTRRCGVLGIKLGQIPQWKKDGTRFLCDVIQIVDNHVIRYTPPEQFEKSAGYYPLFSNTMGSMVVGAMSIPPMSVTKEYNNLFKESGVAPKRKLTRFRVTPDAVMEPGTPLNAMHFKTGDYVTVSAKTKYHGFQGVVKRFGFKGGRASHGTTKSHRRPGSMASGREKGMHKGKKMPGEMGGVWCKTKGIRVWRINTKFNLLYLSTGCPGPIHGFVRIYDFNAAKIPGEIVSSRLMPTYYDGDLEHVPEDILSDELFDMNEESIHFSTDEK